jgi:hypothetical protein
VPVVCMSLIIHIRSVRNGDKKGDGVKEGIEMENEGFIVSI